MKLTTMLLFLATVASAQVPQIINYQGRIVVNGTNFDGTGQFKFAFVDAGTNTFRALAKANVSGPAQGGKITSISVTNSGYGYDPALPAPVVTITSPTGTGATGTAVVAGFQVQSVTVTAQGTNYVGSNTVVTIAAPPVNVINQVYWTNDGSPPTNSQPLTSVSLPVTKGLYSVMLGDTTLANMGYPFPSSLFQYPDVRLRVWFSDGVSGFQQLAPDQRLGSVGYAIQAANASTATTSLVTGYADTSGFANLAGSVQGPNLFVDSTTGNVGIGTTNPVAKLQVAGTFLRVNGAGDEQAYLGGDGVGGDVQIGSMNSTITNLVAYNTTSSSYMDFYARSMFSNGKLGVGTASPRGQAEIVGSWDGNYGALTLSGSNPTLRFVGDSNSAYQQWMIHEGSSPAGNLEIYYGDYDGSSWTSRLAITPNGNLGVGTSTPASKFDVNGNINYSGQLTRLAVADLFTASIGCADFKIGFSGRRGSPGLAFTDNTTELWINFAKDWARVAVNSDLIVYGTNTVCILKITGGCDLAEPFEMSSAKIAPGAVVVIDEENAGQLKLSDRPYDTRVAGIVSGANGVNPGISLSQHGLIDNGKDVALSGRVYVQADASNGAIRPGDLLTTSAVPGHAMKVSDHTRAQGAILGKAMSYLESGRGLVLVLVTLQ